MKRAIVLITAVAMLVALGATPAMANPGNPPAKEKGLEPLDYTPVYYHTDKVVGTEVVNDDWWSGHDEDGTHYDSSTIKMSPNGQTLHDVLKFFGSDVLKRDYFKPFVMTEVDDGLYKSRGELINYEFKEEFGGAKRRAVVTTWLKLDEDDQFKWMVKRVDYYTRGEGKPEYLHSLVYTVWNDELGDENPVSDELESVIEAGPANLGGQRP